jgi:predicted Fe-Mo cluster-binding NifX family protein
MTIGAFATWRDRIAPVFDVATEVCIVEVLDGQVVSQCRVALDKEAMLPKVLALQDLKVETLVCGAISRPLQEMVSSFGVQVFPFVAGTLSEVITAWLGNRLEQDYFSMPGCRGPGRRRRQRGRNNRNNDGFCNGSFSQEVE